MNDAAYASPPVFCFVYGLKKIKNNLSPFLVQNKIFKYLHCTSPLILLTFFFVSFHITLLGFLTWKEAREGKEVVRWAFSRTRETSLLTYNSLKKPLINTL